MKKNFNINDIKRNMSTKKNVQLQVPKSSIDILRERIKRLRERLIWLRSLRKTT